MRYDMATNRESIIQAIVASRKAKGLTQTALATQLGIPQSHVSRLETGKVDLRTSSLIEFARLVDMEVMLVPRKWVPAVRKLVEERDGNPETRFLYRLSR
jgi:transcriptional regulator with XRE-family HTH domain